MKKHIYFVTTNTNKFEEASKWLKELAPDIELEQSKLDLPEIQSLDQKEVTLVKAKDAWAILKKPLLVDDEALFIEKYPLFPGTLTKLIRKTIGIDGILKLAGENKNASIANSLIYLDSEDSYHVFEGVTKGKLREPTKADTEKKLISADVLIVDGYNKTYSELKNTDQVKNFHNRYQAIKKFADWFKSN